MRKAAPAAKKEKKGKKEQARSVERDNCLQLLSRGGGAMGDRLLWRVRGLRLV